MQYPLEILNLAEFKSTIIRYNVQFCFVPSKSNVWGNKATRPRRLAIIHYCLWWTKLCVRGTSAYYP